MKRAERVFRDSHISILESFKWKFSQHLTKIIFQEGVLLQEAADREHEPEREDQDIQL